MLNDASICLYCFRWVIIFLKRLGIDVTIVRDLCDANRLLSQVILQALKSRKHQRDLVAVPTTSMASGDVLRRFISVYLSQYSSDSLVKYWV